RSDGFYYGGSVRGAGINSVRGNAAEALARFITADATCIDRLRPVLDRIVDDPSIAVRSCVADTLVAVLRQDAVLAIPLFLRLCDTEDILLATSSVEVFLSMAVERHFADVELLLQRMLASPVPDVSVAGARQAVWAALLLDQARPLLTQASQGTPAQRLGVAQMLAPNVRFIAGQSNLTDVLGALFDDCDAKVRDAA